MILSRTRKFIFLKTMKTAGTSFEIALSKYAGPDDIITPVSAQDEKLRASLGYRGAQNHRYAADELPAPVHPHPQGLKFYNHMTAAELVSVIGRSTFDEFHKVSIVRNPYDMVVSLYFWEHRNERGLTRDHFKQWLLSRPPALTRNRDITHIENKCVVDRSMRFENIANDIREFSQEVGLPASLSEEFASIRAKSHLRPKQASVSFMFDDFPEGRTLIEEIFEDELRQHHYSL